MSEEVVVKQPDSIAVQGRGLHLNSLDQMWRFAGYVATAKLAPKGMEDQTAVVVALEMGAELGLPPMQSIQNIAVINNRPCVWGDAVPGLVEASGLQEYGYPTKIGNMSSDGKHPNDFGFTYTTKRKGRDEYTYTFTVANAKKASLWGKAGPWTFYPERMLLNRARTFCLRDVYPDVLRGIVTVDEAKNIVDADFDVVEDEKPRTEKLAELIGKKESVVEKEVEPAEAKAVEPPPDPKPKKTKPKAEKKDPGGELATAHQSASIMNICYTKFGLNEENALKLAGDILKKKVGKQDELTRNDILDLSQNFQHPDVVYAHMKGLGFPIPDAKEEALTDDLFKP